jgi:hypothetical protein
MVKFYNIFEIRISLQIIFLLTSLTIVFQSCGQTLNENKDQKGINAQKSKDTIPESRVDYPVSQKVVDTAIIKYSETTESKEGLVLARKGDKVGYTNLKGEVIIPFNFDWGAGDFSEGLAFVRIRNKIGFINIKGQEVIPFIYDNASNFSEGFAMVAIKDKYGYINKNGEIQIKLEYDLAHDFSCGLAQVKKNNKVGFIDTTGKIIIPIIYDGALGFSKKLKIATVKSNGRWHKINLKGDAISY